MIITNTQQTLTSFSPEALPKKLVIVMQVFHQCFFENHRVILQPGGFEPFYSPAQCPLSHHRIVFRQNFLSSALHEICHWCLAGCWRRLAPDYGYTYTPPPRTQQQQQRFQAWEKKNQALEWILHSALGLTFAPSLDNVPTQPRLRFQFTAAIAGNALEFYHGKKPKRFETFLVRILQRFSSHRHYHSYWQVFPKTLEQHLSEDALGGF